VRAVVSILHRQTFSGSQRGLIGWISVKGNIKLKAAPCHIPKKLHCQFFHKWEAQKSLVVPLTIPDFEWY
jgi:hypothetical protein